jgi:hypothetical protein
LAAGVFATSAVSQTPTAPSSGVILGRVVEGLTDRSVADAAIGLRGTAEPYLNLNALTDADGNFVFFNVPAGSYGLTASKTGYWFGEYGQRRGGAVGHRLTLTDGQRVGGVTVPVWKAGAISGVVTDERNDPVAGVLVQAFVKYPAAGRLLISNQSPNSAQTDDRGAYRIFGLIPGQYFVSIAPPAAATALPADVVADDASSVTLALGEERRGIDLRVRGVRTFRLFGRIGGAPLGGIAVQLTIPDERFVNDIVVADAVTHTDGSFVFDGVVPGDYAVRVSGSGRGGSRGGAEFAAVGAPPGRGRAAGANPAGLWGNVPVSVTDANVDGVVVDLRRGRRIAGHIFFDGETGRPGTPGIRNMLLGVYVANGRHARRVGLLQADSDGRFSTTELPPDRYFVRLAAPSVSPGWAIASVMLGLRDAIDEPLVLEDEDLTGVAITLTDKVSVFSGRVSTDGIVDSSASVLVFPADSSRWIDFGRDSPRMRSVRARADGSYAISGLPPGSYLAVAVDDAETERWQTQAMLQQLSRRATKFTIALGEKIALDLRTVRSR